MIINVKIIEFYVVNESNVTVIEVHAFRIRKVSLFEPNDLEI